MDFIAIGSWVASFTHFIKTDYYYINLQSIQGFVFIFKLSYVPLVCLSFLLLQILVMEDTIWRFQWDISPSYNYDTIRPYQPDGINPYY